jgi:hypothetical protein
MMSACMAQAEMLLAGRPDGEIDRELIFDPGQLGATDSVDFCGACHPTSWDVRLSGKTGNTTVISPGTVSKTASDGARAPRASRV